MNLVWTVPAVIAPGAVMTAWTWWRQRRRPDYRSHNDRRAAWIAVCHGPRPEPAQPGTNDALLEQCQAICPDLARKEDR